MAKVLNSDTNPIFILVLVNKGASYKIKELNQKKIITVAA
jgi:hypothetical protein